MPDYTTPPSGAVVVTAGSNIQTAVNNAATGATIWLGAGEHRMQSITPKEGQHFIGADGAILNGSELLTSFTQSGSTWYASGQTQEGLRNATGEGADGAERPGYPETLFIDDVPQTPVDTLGEVTAGKFYFDYTNDRIYFGTNPSGHKVEAGKVAQAISGNAANVTVEHLTVEKYNSPTQYGAIQQGTGANWDIINNEVRLNYGVGIVSQDEAYVNGNNVHHNGEMGLGGSGDDVVIEGNEIHHNGGWSGIDPLWEGGGAKWAVTDGLVVRSNYSHDNVGFGLWTDIDNINTLYEGNLLTGNTLGGITHEISYDATIRNNRFIDNGAEYENNWLWGTAVNLQNSQNVDVYENEIDMTGGGNGIGIVQQDRGTGAYGEYTAQNNSVYDNLIVGMTTDDGVSGIAADFEETEMLSQGNTFDYNEYHHNASSGEEHWMWNEFYDWNAYRTASGQDANSTVSTTGVTIPNELPDLGDNPEEPPPPPPVYTYTPGTWAETAAYTSTITGTTGNNNPLNGTSANNLMNGNGGTDIMYGGAGDDTYIVDSSGDRANETSNNGTDLVLIRTGSFLMTDHVENGKVDSTGNKSVTGSNGDNTIIGGTGSDTIAGDNGADKMTGGAGNDTFVFYATEVAGDQITDFNGNGTSAGDVLRFQGFGTGASLSNTGDTWKITYTGGEEVFKLVGVTALATGDAVFV